jgi:hypothetical protein
MGNHPQDLAGLMSLHRINIVDLYHHENVKFDSRTYQL